jgi:beta-lactam-binding protein with PASTA domain
MKPIKGAKDKGKRGSPRGRGPRRSRMRPVISWDGVLNGLRSGVAVRALGLTLLGFGLGYVFATRVLFPAAPVPEALIEVPSWAGASLEEATAGITELGLDLGAVDSVKHPSTPAGTVFGQSPLPGQLAEPGGTVRLAVSSGPQLYAVPDVSGIGSEQAVAILEASGFGVQLDSVESRRPRGTVLESEPRPGERVTLPLDVRLAVSLGPPLVVVPSLIGMTEEAAVDTLRALGLGVSDIEVRFRFGLDQGKVVEQEPVAGREVEEGSEIRLVVGRRGASEQAR